MHKVKYTITTYGDHLVTTGEKRNFKTSTTANNWCRNQKRIHGVRHLMFNYSISLQTNQTPKPKLQKTNQEEEKPFYFHGVKVCPYCMITINDDQSRCDNC